MADPFGIVAGSVGIAAAFTACVDCFNYVQFGRHFGRDFQTDKLKLDCARLCLTRWGQAVNIYTDDKLGQPNATQDELRNAKQTLFHILALFEDTAKVSKRYKLNSRPGEDLSAFSVDNMDPSVMALDNKMKDLAVRRQKGSSLLNTVKWALYDRSELERLVTTVTSLIDNLERLFPAPRSRQVELVKEETDAFPDEASLQLVEQAAQNVDSVLQVAAKEAITGHRYLNVVIEGKALIGNSVGDSFHGKVVASSHTYDGVKIAKGATAAIGDKHGGKDFWDA